MKKLILLFVVIVAPRLAQAQAFATGYAGDRQSAMGGAGAALAIDPSSISINPASASFLKGNGVSIGGAAAITKSAYLDSNNYSLATSKSPIGTPFHINAVYGVSDSASLLSKFKFGISVTTPYGGSMRWDDNWTGRNALIAKSLSSIAFTPNVSYKISDKLSVGVAVGYSQSFLHVESGLPFDSTSKIIMDFKSSGWGFGGGVFYKPIEKLTLSLGYMSQTNTKSYSGTAKIENVPSSVAPTFPTGNNVSTKSSVPQVISLGVGYNVTDKLLIAFDAGYGFWKCFDSTIFKFADTSSLTTAIKGNSIRQPNLYKGQISLKLGAQYNVTDAIVVRAGVGYDQTPMPSNYVYPDLPDADRINLTLGGGYVIIKDKLNVDVSYRFIDIMKRGSKNLYTNMSGTYKTYGHVAGLTLNYKF